jgi:hypothetical protein
MVIITPFAKQSTLFFKVFLVGSLVVDGLGPGVLKSRRAGAFEVQSFGSSAAGEKKARGLTPLLLFSEVSNQS